MKDDPVTYYFAEQVAGYNLHEAAMKYHDLTKLNHSSLLTEHYYILKAASERLHWIKIGEDGIPELYLDNHMMQTFRACESRGYEEFFVGRKSKNAHYWFLDFGIALHKLIEYYYKYRKDANFDVMIWASSMAYKVWQDLDIDNLYSKGKPWEHKNHAVLGGFMGFSALLMQYAQFFHIDNERFRVIGTELYFGKEKEVYLGTLNFPCPFRLYLSGKIDLLVDDGHNIGPFDHKSSSNFGGKNPIMSYEVHEGMTGYVYAVKELLKVTPYLTESNEYGDTYNMRLTNKIWMNFIQVQPIGQDKKGNDKDVRERFKRIPLFVTDYQLEAYARRQLTTASRMLSLVLYNLEPDRNTMMCTNYMRHNCTYQHVHKQNAPEDLVKILNTDFEIGPIWDPENRDNDNISITGE